MVNYRQLIEWFANKKYFRAHFIQSQSFLKTIVRFQKTKICLRKL